MFFVAPTAAVAAVALHVVRGGSAALPAVVAGAVCSVLTFGITAAGNVPLNNALERAAIHTDAQQRSARHRFELPWNRRNLARTVTSTAALAFIALAAIIG